MSFQSVGPVLFQGASMVTASPKADLGTLSIIDNELYQLVYNCGGSTASVGQSLSRPASAFAGLYSVSVSGSAGGFCMGYVKHADIPTGEYGWALRRGLVTVTVASSASDQAAGPKAIGAAGVAVSTAAAGGHLVGELLTAIVSGNSGSLFVNLP
jgi:hypothetical protein